MTWHRGPGGRSLASNDELEDHPKIAEALELMGEALALLDHAGAPPDVTARVEEARLAVEDLVRPNGGNATGERR